MVVAWLAVVAAVLASLSGCGSCGEAVPCPNGLGISVASATGKAFADGRYAIDAKLDGVPLQLECTITSASPSCTAASLSVKRDAGGSLVISLPEATPKSVELTLRFEGTVIATTAFDPNYFQYQPNGEDCAPTCYVATHGMRAK